MSLSANVKENDPLASGVLYAIFLDYESGTYVAQTRSSQLPGDLEDWARRIADDDLATWKLDRNDLLAIIATDDPVPISEAVNVWCLSGVDKRAN
jgi:hypothetical protein